MRGAATGVGPLMVAGLMVIGVVMECVVDVVMARVAPARVVVIDGQLAGIISADGTCKELTWHKDIDMGLTSKR